MAIYVDDMQLPVRAGRHDSAGSHMFADIDDELHAVAEERELKPERFQEGNRQWLNHYDVTAGKRQQAIRLRATPITNRDAGQIIVRVRARAGSGPEYAASEHALAAKAADGVDLREPGGRDDAPAARQLERKAGAEAKRHSWEKHDDYNKTCRDCGIKVLARPHPYERRWYQEYTTADGRCPVADRVPPCEPAAHPRPAPEDERVRAASELDRAAGRAWQHGDLERAARLIADARALDPARSDRWAGREATIAASAPRPGRSTQPEPAGYRRACTALHPHQDAYLAARRSMEVGGTGRCQDGHPVSDLRQDVTARLIAAGFTASSPELARIREWNCRALDRAGIAPADRDEEAETT